MARAKQGRAQTTRTPTGAGCHCNWHPLHLPFCCWTPVLSAPVTPPQSLQSPVGHNRSFTDPSFCLTPSRLNQDRIGFLFTFRFPRTWQWILAIIKLKYLPEAIPEEESCVVWGWQWLPPWALIHSSALHHYGTVYSHPNSPGHWSLICKMKLLFPHLLAISTAENL